MASLRLPKNNIFIIILLSFTFCGFLPGKAASLEETALRLLTESNEFKSRNFSLESAMASLATASNLPDPELSGEFLVAPQDVDNRWAAEVSWSVEWPGVYKARGKEAQLKLKAEEKALYLERNEKLVEIKDLLIDYVQCHQKLALLEELTQNNDTIYHLAHEAAKGGELTVLDLNKVKLEYANIRVAKASLIDEQNRIIADLSTIFGKDCTKILGNMACVFPEIVIPASEDLTLIVNQNPSVENALAKAEAAKQSKKVAKMEALPSLALGYKHAFEDGMHFNGVTWGISLPFFSSHKKQKAAEADIRATEYDVEMERELTESQISQTVERLRKVKYQIDEIAPIVENADYNAILLKAYKGGVMTLIEYITDRNYFTAAALELVTLRNNAAKIQNSLYKYFFLATTF